METRDSYSPITVCEMRIAACERVPSLARKYGLPESEVLMIMTTDARWIDGRGRILVGHLEHGR